MHLCIIVYSIKWVQNGASLNCINLPLIGDVLITQYGKVVAKLTNSFQDRVEIVESLFGILPHTMTIEEVLEERMDEA